MPKQPPPQPQPLQQEVVLTPIVPRPFVAWWAGRDDEGPPEYQCRVETGSDDLQQQRWSLLDDLLRTKHLKWWRSWLAAISLCFALGAIQFALMPNRNPLHDQRRTGIWHCSLNCAVVFCSLFNLLWTLVINRCVLEGSSVQLRFQDLVKVWFLGAFFGFLPVHLLVNSVWVYPFPYGAGVSLLVSLLLSHFAMIAILRPQIKSAVSPDETRLYFYRLNMLMVLLIQGIALICGAMFMVGALSQGDSRIARYSVAVCVAPLRLLARLALDAVMRRVGAADEASVVVITDTYVMVLFSCAMTLLIGNSGDFALAFLMALMDSVQGIFLSLLFTDNCAHRLALRAKLFGRRPQDYEVQSSIRGAQSTYVALEIGEVLVPMAFLPVFLIIYFSPNAQAFTGIGTSDFGISPPLDIRKFTEATVAMTVSEILGAIILKILVHRLVRVDTMAAMSSFYAEYGVVLTLTKVLAVHGVFCLAMLSCGFDYSLRFAHIRGQ
mmetsp:Transcript_28557/g.78397  ORF Transcript_28557/g.78397 Transcript_28557/m.78397 type:complete len:493 (-) Transcript_28557:226-1704(-)